MTDASSLATTMNRILKDECLPDWAVEKLAQLRQVAAQSPSMNEMTM